MSILFKVIMKGNVLKVLKHLSHTLFQFFKTLNPTNIRTIWRVPGLVAKILTTIVSQLICSFMEE